MAGIFLSYRRSDATGWAGRLHDSLVQRLPGVKIFMDVEEIPPGVRFADYIHEAVGSCDVLLALIGPAWLTVTNDDGTRRLDDPADFARLEIVAALERGVRVVPTLVGGAAMPQASGLPGPLRELCDRQNYELTDRAWEDGCNRLAKALAGLVNPERAPLSKAPAIKTLAMGGVLTALVIAAGAALWAMRSGKPDVQVVRGPAPSVALTPSSAPASASDYPPALVVAPATAFASAAPSAPQRTAVSTRKSLPDPAQNRQTGSVDAGTGALSPRPTRPQTELDDELWLAAEAAQKRAGYIDYLFRLPSGAHVSAARAKAGAYWLRDSASGCAMLIADSPGTQQPRLTWKGACAGGKAQGQGTVTIDRSSPARHSVGTHTFVEGLASGPCTSEIRVEEILRLRRQGVCQDFLSGDVASKFDGDEEAFDNDGRLSTTFKGVITLRWSGEREARGERTSHQAGYTFAGTEQGDVSNGTLKLKSGKTIRCRFVKGKANGSNCEVNFVDGSQYKGELADGRSSGRGLLRFPSGRAYEGEFRDDSPSGQGVQIEPDGTKLIGTFATGKLNGDVVILTKDGRRTSAHFVAGVRDR